MSYDKSHLSIGSVRCANERRQYGGLLMLTGVCAVFAPIGSIVTAIGTEGLLGDTTDPSTIPFWRFVGGCCMMAIGISAVLTGFAECIHDAGNTRVTTWAILLTQVRKKRILFFLHWCSPEDSTNHSFVQEMETVIFFFGKLCTLYACVFQLLLFRYYFARLQNNRPPSFLTLWIWLR